MKIGDKVKVLRSSHPDIQEGDKGVVESKFCDGVGVKFDKNFYEAGGVRKQERVVFFSPADLELDIIE